MKYPIANFYARRNEAVSLLTHTEPQEGDFVSNVLVDTQLYDAFNFQPGHAFELNSDDGKRETWEVMTDVFNESYIWCKESNAFAYFANNGTTHYFTNYIGDKGGLLYLFYLSAYKVLLSSEKQIIIEDSFPVNVFANNMFRWIQDLFSPLYIFIKINFKGQVNAQDNLLGSGVAVIESELIQQSGWIKKKLMSSCIEIRERKLDSFTVTSANQTKTIVKCRSVN